MGNLLRKTFYLATPPNTSIFSKSVLSQSEEDILSDSLFQSLFLDSDTDHLKSSSPEPILYLLRAVPLP